MLADMILECKKYELKHLIEIHVRSRRQLPLNQLHYKNLYHNAGT